jgi:transcription termination/antitermination protein NusA
MKSDFLLAITQLSAEKNLPKEVVLAAVETALVSAYRKDSFATNQNIAVKINPSSGKVEVWAEKTIVEKVSDPRIEITLNAAKKVRPDAKMGEMVMVEDTPVNAGRIAAQTAKQVILQRLHEAEHSAIFEEFANREEDIVTGMVRRTEPKQVYVDLGRTEAILPASEQMPNEHYRVGQRLKVFLLEVVRTTREPRVVVSRSHPNLLRRLFESEVPEVYNGTVEIKSIAREAGFRSKVAVAAKQEGIDPVGCCVGLRGIRIQNIVSELNGEKIDVVAWNPQSAAFIASALSPAQVLHVDLNEKEKVATVIIPDKQLSLAIGKEGQNVRLAAKLTDWKIDIKSATAYEAQKAELAKAAAEAEVVKEPELVEAEIEAEVAAPASKVAAPEKPVEVPAGAAAEKPEEGVTMNTGFPAQGAPFEPVVAAPKSELRFAEDIMSRAAKPVNKTKDKKKGKDKGEDGIKMKKARRARTEIPIQEDEEY